MGTNYNGVVYYSKLSKKEQEFVKNLVLKEEGLREILKTREYVVEVTIPYDNVVTVKKVLLPARFTWSNDIVEGGGIKFEPVKVEEENTPSQKTSSSNKVEEDKKDTISKSELNSVPSIFKRWFFQFLFGTIAVIIISMALGILPSIQSGKMDVSQKVHSAQMGFIDTNFDCIPDENAAEIAAQDSYYRNMESFYKTKALVDAAQGR